MNTPTASVLLAFSALVMASCAGTPEAIKDREGYMAQLREREQSNARIKQDARSIPKILQDFDKAIDKYVGARAKLPDARARRLVDTLDRILRQEARRNFYLLLSRADDASNPADRGIALAALGFADATEEIFEKADREFLVTLKQKTIINEANRKYTRMALDSMITALHDEDERIVLNSLLGLGILAHEDTPVDEIGQLLENDKRERGVRLSAAWALDLIQPQLTPQARQKIRPILQRVLMEPLGKLEGGILIHLLSCLGHFRDRADAKLIEPYCAHPDGLVRSRAAIALGLTMNQDSIPRLLELIKDSEANLNVRLAARKSLKALAGGKDRGYDVTEWQKLFQLK